MRIAVLLAKRIGGGVLRGEVENINREANVIKEFILLDHLCERAVVVEEDVIWLQTIDTERPFDEFLTMSLV